MTPTNLSSLNVLFTLSESTTQQQKILHDIIDNVSFKKSATQSTLTHDFQSLLFYVLSHDVRDDQLESLLQENSVQSPELFTSVIASRRTELSKLMKKLSVEQLSSNYLKDFDWKLHLIIASDKCSMIRQPVLILSLQMSKDNTILLLEVTKDDLDMVLGEFDKIHNTLQKLVVF